LPIDARQRSSSPGIVGGSGTFSWKSRIRPSTSDSMTPNSRASCLGTGIAATVTPAPTSTWLLIICCGSMR
jgi:hypothetical protein